jgi:hypothetical protein
MISVTMLSVIQTNVTMLSVIQTNVTMLSVIQTNVTMLSVMKTNVTMLSATKTYMPSLKCAIMANVVAPKVAFLPAIPTAVKTEAATAAKIVPAREKWTAGNVSFELGANVVSGSNDVIVYCHLPVNLS